MVARPTRWGNPFTIASAVEAGFLSDGVSERDRRAFVVDCFRSWLTLGPASPWWFEAGAERHTYMVGHLADLRGQDLACWCPLDHPCHADVLLELGGRH